MEEGKEKMKRESVRREETFRERFKMKANELSF